MKLKILLVAGMSVFALAGCDAILEDEGTGPPPPNLPAPPPLDDDVPMPVETATPVATPTPDMTAPPMTIPTSSPATDPSSTSDPLPTPTPTDAGETPDDSVSPHPDQAQILQNLALINAAPCAAVQSEDSATIAQVANASAPAPTGNLVSAQVVGGGVSAVALTALRADFPGIAKLEPRRDLGDGVIASGHCGATRISNNWFVTAAHCLDEPYDETVLKVGFEILDKPITRDIETEWSVCHMAYGGAKDGYSNDIALIKVSDAAASGMSDVPIASLIAPTASVTPLNTPTAKMAGWGMTAPGGALSNTLLGTQVKIASVGPALIRVASIDGRGPCIGDSGGPLFVSGEGGTPILTGVLSGVEQVSGQRACEGDYTARYTNLQGYLGWMQTVVQTCEANEELCTPG
ncbi:MAG: peptidase S1 [Hirschia sp.]|nr:peptidase S1 [Hirschia sp.]MBF18106.1 peptidase S1 [Hirschia sp.]